MKQTTLKLTVICLLTNVQCSKSRFQGIGVGHVTPPPQQTGLVSAGECDFYKIESAIINCKEQRKFFKQTLPERKNIVSSSCLKQAFSSVWGANFNPSPYIYDPESVKNTNFHWSFSFGNIQKGSPSAFPPNSLELKYAGLSSQFQNSLDRNQMNQCLGGNYNFDGPTIINTSLNMITLGLLEPETFIRCYREQLEMYKAKRSCPNL